MRKIALLMLTFAYVLSNDFLPVEHIGNKTMDINGHFFHYGEDKYDWIYIDQKTQVVSKLVGAKEDGSLEWNSFPQEYFDSITFDPIAQTVQLIPKSNEKNPFFSEVYPDYVWDQEIYPELTNMYTGAAVLLGGFIYEERSWKLYYPSQDVWLRIRTNEPYGISDDGLNLIYHPYQVYSCIGCDSIYKIDLVSYLGNGCFKVLFDERRSPDYVVDINRSNATLCQETE